MMCAWKQDGDGVVCVQCDKRQRKETHRNCPTFKGAGDKVKKLTTAMGIKKSCGGCNKRQHIMNDKWATPQFRDCRWITTEEYVQAVHDLVTRLPDGIDGVAGVPRSGMLGATVIAMALHVPLYTLKDGEVISVGAGTRSADVAHGDPDNLLVFDDTVMQGGTLRSVREQYPQALFAAAFVNPGVKDKVDVVGRPLKSPHLLQWNFANSFMAPNAGFDIDGVLTVDNTTEPWIVPRFKEVGALITARPETMRAETVAWLEKHGAKYKELVMWEKPEGRVTLEDVTKYKADAINARKLDWYIESHDTLAMQIAQHTHAWCVCPTTGNVY